MLFERFHESYVHRRRADILAGRIARILPRDASVLDVGAGDGLIASKVAGTRPDVRLRAVETLVRPGGHLPIEPFDGVTLPFSDRAFDTVTLVDVLHHADEPVALLAEAKRVASRALIVKDVMSEGLLARETLHLMERLANTAHGISIPDTFWRRREWDDVIRRLQLDVASWDESLGLYPFPANLVFERRFHFLAELRV